MSHKPSAILFLGGVAMVPEPISLYKGVPEEDIKSVEVRYQDYLRQLLRYDRFRLEESHEEWVSLLGPDVLSATHPYATAELICRLVAIHEEQGVPLDKESELLLLTSALVHDWGEIVIAEQGIGDVSFDQKTAAHEQVEVSIFELVCQDLPEGANLELIRKAYYEVAQKKEGLGEIFNAVERIGYWLTALRAFKGSDGKRIKNWQGLVGNVLSNQTEKLLDYTKKLLFVRNILEETAAEITTAFEELDALEIAPHDKNGQPSYDVNKLKAAYELWKSREVKT